MSVAHVPSLRRIVPISDMPPPLLHLAAASRWLRDSFVVLVAGDGMGDSAGILGLQPKLWKPQIHKWGRVERADCGFNLNMFSSADDFSRFCVRSSCSLVDGTLDQCHLAWHANCNIFARLWIYGKPVKADGRLPSGIQVCLRFIPTGGFFSDTNCISRTPRIKQM